jgi:hypothetical protein
MLDHHGIKVKTSEKRPPVSLKFTLCLRANVFMGRAYIVRYPFIVICFAGNSSKIGRGTGKHMKFCIFYKFPANIVAECQPSGRQSKGGSSMFLL